MNLKDDINDVANEVKEIKQTKSFAYEMLKDARKENDLLKVILTISIISNIIIALLLK